MHASGNVELWLRLLTDAQQKSLHNIIHEAWLAINDESFDLLLFLNNYLAQVFDNCTKILYYLLYSSYALVNVLPFTALLYKFIMRRLDCWAFK